MKGHMSHDSRSLGGVLGWGAYALSEDCERRHTTAPWQNLGADAGHGPGEHFERARQGRGLRVSSAEEHEKEAGGTQCP